MLRAIRFAVGLTLIFLALVAFLWVSTYMPGIYLLGTAVVAIILLLPGALLLGMAFWPPEDQQDKRPNNQS